MKHTRNPAGRDYRTGSKYEYCVFDGERIVAREGFFPTNAQAKKAGIKTAQNYLAHDDIHNPLLKG